MESGALTNLSLIFLAVGFSLWVTAVVLSRQARRHQHCMEQLLQLASQNIDTLDLPAAAWPSLQAAGWLGMQWSGQWYGQPVAGQLGQSVACVPRSAEQQTFSIESGQDVTLQFILLNGAPRGTRHLFARQLAQVFVLLVETRLRERTGALSAALAEQARLTLYLQHDMRNLAQWVVWVSADFSEATLPADLLAAGNRLRENAPLALDRAQRLIAALGKPSPNEAQRAIALRPALEDAARMAGIELAIEGDGFAWITPGALARTLDNLLSKLAADWREGRTAPAQAELATAEELAHGKAALTLRCTLPAEGVALPPERLFEPFASGRPGGLGLGLFQARKGLADVGGSLQASVVGDQLCFALYFPQTPRNPPASTIEHHQAQARPSH